MKIGDRCFVHGYVDEIRKDTVIVRNKGGYFGTDPGEVITVYNTTHPNWIPCSERLPEDDVEVLVTDDSGGVQWLGIDKMLSYEDGSGRFWLTSQNPTAWMPLPAPYIERREE